MRAEHSFVVSDDRIVVVVDVIVSRDVGLEIVWVSRVLVVWIMCIECEELCPIIFHSIFSSVFFTNWKSKHLRAVYFLKWFNEVAVMHKNYFSNFVCVSICFVGVSIFAHAYCFGWEISDFRIISWHLILVDADDNLNFIRCLFAFDICSAWFFLFGPCWRFVVKFQF